MSRERVARVRRLVVWSCGLLVTGPAMLAGVLLARLAGMDLAGWPAWLVVAAVTALLAGAAGALSEPLVSRLQNLIERWAVVSADEHTPN